MSKNAVPAKIITSLVLLCAASVLLLFLFSDRFTSVRRELFGRTAIGEPVLEVTFLYVGQGDAVVIRELGGRGRVMLIDTGPNAAAEEFAAAVPVKGSTRAATAIIPYLKEKGVDKIDYLVLTHKHGDHIGGAPYILRNFKVGTVYDNGTDYPSPYTEEYLRAVRETGVNFRVARAGETLPFGENITAQFIGPLRRYQGTLYSDENCNSIVTRVVAGKISFLFAGDMEIAAELDLMAYGDDLQTTVMMAPHHGSHSSSSRPFLSYIRPEVAVFSAGRNNRYSLPAYEIIRRYEDMGAAVYRTDMDGHVKIVTDGRSYSVRTQK